MSTFGTRMQMVMTERKISRKELAEKLNVTTMAIGNLLKDKVRKPQTLEIATALGVEPEWLLNGGDGEMNIGGNRSGSEDSIILTLMDNRLAAGDGFINFDYPDTVRSIEFSPEKFMEIFQRKTAANLTMAIIDGSSMYDPNNEEMSLKHGDIVFIDTAVREFKNDGIYAFEQEGHARIKRLQYMSGHRLKVISDNPTYETEILEPEQAESIRIIGKLIKKMPLEIIDL